MLLNRLLSALVFALALDSPVQAYGDPGACSGDCWAHDPALIRRTSDGTYFRFNTGSEIGIWKSSSLTGPWVYQGKVLPNGSSINLSGNKDCWAPDVNLIGSTYILYYAVSTFGSQNSAIGYATSPTMEAGSWTDHGATGISSSSGKAYNAIDPNLVQAGSSYYMTFGSFWADIYQAPMNAGATAPASSSYQIAYNSSGSHALEGAFVYYRSGYYYLFFSSGVCCGYDTSKPSPGNEYKIYVCRSSSVSGPFVDSNGKSCTAGGGTVVLESHGYVYGPGGQGVMADPTYGTVLYYHYGTLLPPYRTAFYKQDPGASSVDVNSALNVANTNVGIADSAYRFGWNTVYWSSGWPSV